MMKLYRVLIVLTCLISVTSCQKSEPAKFETVLKFSLEYLIKTKTIPDEYAVKTLKIVKPKGLVLSDTLTVNGKRCEILPENTDINKLLEHLVVFDPIPLVEISSFSQDRDRIKIALIFRATGHFIVLDLIKQENDHFKVESLENNTM